MKPLGLYIHIPFCKKKCIYCDFNSYSGLESLEYDYINALLLEIEDASKRFSDEYKIETIYIGGGTPTLIKTSMLENIINLCHKKFNIINNCEISIEANPGTVDHDKLEHIHKVGINRISFGLQSWNETELDSIGRIHTASEFEHSFNLAKKKGFKNINIDIMYSIPGQTLSTWEETLNNVISLGPEHISCYGLKVEKGTRLFYLYNKGLITLTDEDTDRNMYNMAIEKLLMSDYNHYEISNFAKKGYECRHNISCWKAGEYIGLGCGAHSHINGERYNNVVEPSEYIRKLKERENISVNRVVLSKEDEISEYIFLGLRLRDGINIDEFYNRFQLDLEKLYKKQINKYMKLELLEKHGANYKLTLKGINISNFILSEFLL
jgi:oxygen-independent coproporphyrinogen-3 oxidase